MLQELSETKTALETSTSESLHQAELAEVVRQKGQFMKRNAELQQINGKVQSTLEIQTQELRSLQFIYEELQMRYRHLEAKSEKLRPGQVRQQPQFALHRFPHLPWQLSQHIGDVVPQPEHISQSSASSVE